MRTQKNFSKTFKIIFYAFIVYMLIAGIIAGVVFRNEITEDINWTMMLSVWLSGGVIALILYAVYAHFENQEVQIELLSSIEDKLNSQKKNDTTIKTEHDNKSAQWLCTNCGLRNNNDTAFCKSCGTER